ncbi:uncharacterized protein LOC143029130 [Oratosquilla oratoria]|uniref:uncharacterized protein LOC143029130 n=1 Tax=Oratosquilla oratoria TaxID=337810 RepID=UPI003F7739B5
MAEMLKNYFTVFTEDVALIPDIEQVHSETKYLEEVDISIGKITEKLKKLKPEKSMGNDSIYSIVLRNLRGTVATPLQKIFTKTLDTGDVPEDWRTANVTPTFKKISKDLVSNYRSISLTLQVSKVLESLKNDEVMKHLLTNNLIKGSQHDFMSKIMHKKFTNISRSRWR